MKPNKEVARRGDYTFAEVPHATGAALIKAHHYARGCSKTGNMFGMFKGERLVGVAQWLPPTKVAAQSVLRDYWQRVISLTRLVVVPGEPQNATSMLVSSAVRYVFEKRLPDGRKMWLAALTYADESEGHSGAIYRATNWTYLGRTQQYPRWKTAAGVQVSTKAGPKTRTAVEMRALGCEIVGHYRKHKFVKFNT